MQFSSHTVIQWEWAQGSCDVRLIEPFTHLAPRFDALWSDVRLLVHRSAPNESARQRRAMLLSFQPAGRGRQHELEWRPDRVDELP